MPSPQILIRPARAEDSAQIARVHVSAVRHGYRGLVSNHILDGLDEVKRAAQWRSAIEKLASDRCLYVAASGSAVVGFAGGGPARKHDEAGMGELYVLSVDPSEWRKGFGVALTAAVERWLSTHFQGAVLWVLSGNVTARLLYESCGWTTDGTSTEDEVYAASAVRYRKAL